MPSKKKNTPIGRPTKYKPEYCQIAYHLAREKYTDKDIAGILSINVDTIHQWKKAHPEFADALRGGKAIIDQVVEGKLLARAVGYEYHEVTREAELIDTPDGKKRKVMHVTKVVTKHLPPDVGAQTLWLKNRKPDEWREKSEIDINLPLNEFIEGSIELAKRAGNADTETKPETE